MLFRSLYRLSQPKWPILKATFGATKDAKKQKNKVAQKVKAKAATQAAEAPPTQQLQTSSFDAGAANSFYRNTIRRVNVSSTGRGKFIPSHLVRIIRLINNRNQQPLLFEAYYNYLGHFTMIPNKFVDWMISKNFRIGGGFDNVLTLLANHNYLAYFPSYFTTKIVIIKVSKDQEKYGKLLDIFIASPLIKFNREIVDILLQSNRIVSTSNFSKTVKLVIMRGSFNLFDQFIMKGQLLKKIVEIVNNRWENNCFERLKRNVFVGNFCNAVTSNQGVLEQQLVNVAILSLVFSNFYDTVNAIRLLTQKTSLQSLNEHLTNFFSKVHHTDPWSKQKLISQFSKSNWPVTIQQQIESLQPQPQEVGQSSNDQSNT